MRKANSKELEGILEQLAERLKKLDAALNRTEYQIRDLYGRVKR